MRIGFFRPADARNPDDQVRHAYECLRNLLNRNSSLLEQMAEIEADLRFSPAGSPQVSQKIVRMADETLLLAEDLNVLTGRRFKRIYAAYDRIRAQLNETLRPLVSESQLSPMGVSLDARAGVESSRVGGKACNLVRAGLALPGGVPPGFVITTAAYWHFLHEGGVLPGVLPLLRELEVIKDPDLFRFRLEEVRGAISKARLPEAIQEEIRRQASGQRAPHGWAVRSSAVGEDERYSFAGQFESLLHVTFDGLSSAYRRIVQSRFDERAAAYRRALGLREIDAPMAVLFLAMVEAKSAGVVYTRDPGDAGGERMLVQSVWGLAGALVAGKMQADRFSPVRSGSRGTEGEKYIVPKTWKLAGAPEGGTREEPISDEDVLAPSLCPDDLQRLSEIALRLESQFHVPLDIEWVLDPQGRIWVVQVRPLDLGGAVPEVHGEEPGSARILLEAGIPIHAGRASGPPVCQQGALLPRNVPEGSILVVSAPTPDISTLLPLLSGCVAEFGNPAGHAAAILREWRVPSLFGVPDALRVLRGEEMIALDVARRRIYKGSPWPVSAGQKMRDGPAGATPWEKDPLCRHIFPLHLSDPSSPRFRPEGCTSLHDIIRFVHEEAVESMFQLGDKYRRGKASKAVRLKTDLPLNLIVLDLGGGLAGGTEERKSVGPPDIHSVPFRAIWKGMSDPAVRWTGRRQVSLKGFSSVLVSSMAAAGSGGRRLGDWNYLFVARDYMNMNLRLAYHYAMVDCFVGENPENNFVTFRFRGGAAGPGRRELRARFLSEVLLRSRFVVDRRGDLVTAWLRRYPRKSCEEALAMLGRLMGCCRQLDMLMESPKAAQDYANQFLANNLDVFG